MSQLELTGAEVYAQTLVAEQRTSHQVFLISDKIHVELPIPWTSLKISTKSFWQRMRNILLLRKFLREQNIQIIHCHSRAAARHAYWARLGLKIGMVTTLHGRQHFSFSKRLLDIYGEYQIAICKNVALSQTFQFKTPNWKIKLAANPVADTEFTKSLTGQKRILIAGRNSGPKGERIQQLVLESLPEVFKKFPDLQVDIISGPKSKWAPGFLKAAENYKSQLHIHEAVKNLNQRLKDYQLVIASGRIAIESLLAGIPCFALGEYESLGLVRKANLSEAFDSNFGDIGSNLLEKAVDYSEIKNQLESFLQNPLPELERKEIKDQVQLHFNSQHITKLIEDTYKAAYFKVCVPKTIPILMYHKIPDSPLQTKHRIFVTKDNFEKHLRFFKESGFSTLHFAELKKFWDLEKDYSHFPKKPLLLTFDDGYKDNLTNAEPLLKQYQMKATLFLLADHSIVENTWDADTGETPHQLMTLPEKKQLDPQVFEIGSHGYHHLHLNQIPVQEAFTEMKKSKEILEVEFKRPITAMAYPFGSINALLPEIARQAGYSFAVNTDNGGLHFADDPRSLFRANIFPEETKASLKKKTSWWYRKYFYLKRGH